ncbi:hypothetical protein OSB04_010771 [Centaurea solstitialis]|uniref:Endonuclease/exonuclease/phosphatase domain-containing protein n=1 Tax=Centaurea solstitialis TaxID=347529 RepID=A0AA38WD42_9ASTR|nr:hypothetical protein OSB04_010771 [Centaurea solstitialis]
MLKILSWNINGMGKETKRKWVKDIVATQKISFLCLQETKMVVEHDWQVSSVWGRKSMEFVALDSCGHSSGILTVWNCDLFKVTLSTKHDGFVAVLGLWLSSNTKLGVINVYAPQEARLKKALWGNIKTVLHSESDAAWVVCGDFNEVRSAEERKGSVFDSRGARCFNGFISSTSLTDLRLGVNPEFVDTWPSANSLALPRILSDHCPILLDSRSADFGPSPFKLFNSWPNNPELEGLVRDRWNDSRPEYEVFSKIEKLSRKLRHLKSIIKEWRAGKTKDNDLEIDSLKQKIAAIDLLAEVGNVDDTSVNDRAELSAKLNDLLSSKLTDLKQKAKSKWLLDGDENSRFYHGIINNKRKSSRLNGLNINGTWVTGPDRIKEAARVFFENKFKESHPVRPTINSPMFKKLSDSQKNWLEASFSEQEIKSAVWSCRRNKAPGPDGFTFEFIRKFWTIMGKDFIEAVIFFESNSLINPGSNSSFITLVSKVNDPLSLLDYRPISLIGCITKVISKVLAERLKGVLDSIVSNSQTAFIKGRSILDGPLMISEILNWAKKKRKKLLDNT